MLKLVNIQSRPTPSLYENFPVTIPPVDLSKIVFTGNPVVNQGNFYSDEQLPRPFFIQNLFTDLDILFCWNAAILNPILGEPISMFASTVGNLNSTSYSGAISGGFLYVRSGGIVAYNPVGLNYGYDDPGIHFTGSITLTEICGYVFNRLTGFGSSAANYAAIVNDSISAQAFKFTPNLIQSYDFTAQTPP